MNPLYLLQSVIVKIKLIPGMNYHALITIYLHCLFILIILIIPVRVVYWIILVWIILFLS